jgi:peptidoglycan/xylan/chitin deacetylase (PgdA/CDA1 family)
MRGALRNSLVRFADWTLPLHRPLDKVISELCGRDQLVAIASHLYGDEPEAVVRAKLRLLVAKFQFLPVSEALRRLEEGSLPRRAAIFTVDDVTPTFVRQTMRLLLEAGIPFAVAPIPGLITAEEQYHYVARVMRVAGTYEHAIPKIMVAWSEVLGAGPKFETYAELFDALQPLSIVSLEALRVRLGVPVDEFATWDELKPLRHHRVEFLSHSMSHPMMWRTSGAWLDWELGESKRLLEKNLEVEVQGFVFPVGASINSTPEVQLALANAGYRSAFLLHRGAISPSVNRYCLPRVGFERSIGLLNLATSKGLLCLAHG